MPGVTPLVSAPNVRFDLAGHKQAQEQQRQAELSRAEEALSNDTWDIRRGDAPSLNRVGVAGVQYGDQVVIVTLTPKKSDDKGSSGLEARYAVGVFQYDQAPEIPDAAGPIVNWQVRPTYYKVVFQDNKLVLQQEENKYPMAF